MTGTNGAKGTTASAAKSSKIRRVSAVFLLVVWCASSDDLGAQIKPTDEDRVWSMKFEAGPVRARPESNVRVLFTKQGIVCRAKKQQDLRISPDSVTELIYSPLPFSRFRQAAKFLPDPGSASGDPRGAAGALMLYLVAAAIFGPMHGRDHYVYVIWQREGVEQELVLRADKNEYAAFFQRLQVVTGKNLADVEQERDRILQGIAEAKSNSFSLVLDRTALVGWATLQPGEYQLVLLESAGSAPELCFFSGKEVLRERLAAIALVEKSQPVSRVSLPTPVYQLRGGATTLAAIQGPSQTLRLRL